jgi:hypothetical protein
LHCFSCTPENAQQGKEKNFRDPALIREGSRENKGRGKGDGTKYKLP